MVNAIMRGTTAIVGIGETPFHKRGTSGQPALKLALRAIVAACEDAGINPSEVDGFVSYGSERSDGQRMMPALGTEEIRFAALAARQGDRVGDDAGLASRGRRQHHSGERPGEHLGLVLQRGVEQPPRPRAIWSPRRRADRGVPGTGREVCRVVIDGIVQQPAASPGVVRGR